MAVDDRDFPIRKWRPSLALVIGLSLAATLVLPVLGFLSLRWVTPIFGWKISVVGISAILTVAVCLIGALQWRILVRPMRELAQSAKDLTLGATSRPTPLAHYGTAELREMGESVLRMADRLLDRQHALQGYADHVVHELKSPVTTLRAAVEVLEMPNLSDGQRADLLADVAASAGRMSDLLDALHRHSRSAQGQLDGQTPVRDLPLVCAADIFVFGNPVVPLPADAAKAVLTQLIQNARDAGADRIDICETENGLILGDTGIGMDALDLDRAFDPFFTTKRASGGTGMGLPVVKSLLESGGAEVAMWRKSGGIGVSLHKARKVVSKTSRSPHQNR